MHEFIKNYCHIWIHLWIHICKYEFTYKTLLVPPISYVFFHKFINSYMYSWFSMNTCMKWWYESICKPFWHPWFNIFNEFIPDVMDFGPFSWKRSYSKSCLKNIEKQKVKSIVISCKFKKNSQLMHCFSFLVLALVLCWTDNERNIVRWNRRLVWSVSNKPDLNWFEYKIWKFLYFTVLIIIIRLNVQEIRIANNLCC